MVQFYFSGPCITKEQISSLWNQNRGRGCPEIFVLENFDKIVKILQSSRTLNFKMCIKFLIVKIQYFVHVIIKQDQISACPVLFINNNNKRYAIVYR